MRVPSFHAFRSGRASVAVVLKQLWSWGTNASSVTSGQLGLGDVTNRSSPVQVGALTNWSSISGGNPTFATAIKTDGTLWSWGANTTGNLGLGDIIGRSSPVQIGALTAWSKVSSGGFLTVAIKTDGTLWSWGSNGAGGLGLGDVTNRSSPVQVGALTTWSVVSARTHVLGIKTDGTLWAWGRNNQGALGLGDTISRSSPVQVGTETNWASVTSIFEASFAVKTDGTLWSWGSNISGVLGLGNTTNRSSPVQVGALTTWSSKIAGSGIPNSTSATQHVLAIKTDGTLWSWGLGNYGCLGLGNTTNRSSPVQVGALTTWDVCSAGSNNQFGRGFSAAIKTNGTLWTWGDNQGYYGNPGQLGLGDTISRSSPVQVGALTTWISVSLSGGDAVGARASSTRGAMFALRS